MEWRSWYVSRHPEKQDTPEPAITALQRFLLLRVLRPDRFHVACSEFFGQTLGEESVIAHELSDVEMSDSFMTRVKCSGSQGILVLLASSEDSFLTSAGALCTDASNQSAVDGIQQLAQVCCYLIFTNNFDIISFIK